MFDGEALCWPWVKDARGREPRGSNPRHASPRQAISLAATPERAPPQIGDVVAERRQRAPIRRHRVVGEVAGHHRTQPLTDQADAAVQLVLEQAQALGDEWTNQGVEA